MTSTCAQCGHEYPNASAARYCCTDKPCIRSTLLLHGQAASLGRRRLVTFRRLL